MPKGQEDFGKTKPHALLVIHMLSVQLTTGLKNKETMMQVRTPGMWRPVAGRADCLPWEPLMRTYGGFCDGELDRLFEQCFELWSVDEGFPKTGRSYLSAGPAGALEAEAEEAELPEEDVIATATAASTGASDAHSTADAAADAELAATMQDAKLDQVSKDEQLAQAPMQEYGRP